MGQFRRRGCNRIRWIGRWEALNSRPDSFTDMRSYTYTPRLTYLTPIPKHPTSPPISPWFPFGFEFVVVAFSSYLLARPARHVHFIISQLTLSSHTSHPLPVYMIPLHLLLCLSYHIPRTFPWSLAWLYSLSKLFPNHSNIYPGIDHALAKTLLEFETRT